MEAGLDSQLREQRWSVWLVLGTVILGGRPSSAVLLSVGMEGFPNEVDTWPCMATSKNLPQSATVALIPGWYQHIRFHSTVSIQ